MFAPCSFTTCMHAQTDRPTRLATNGFPTQTFFPESFLFRIPDVYLCIVLCAKSRKNLSLKKPSETQQIGNQLFSNPARISFVFYTYSCV